MRVFISSTCYDLIDLRAELEDFFRNADVTPVLSDSLTSEFHVSPDCNSIETCLANVRDCDEFLIILCNRYGPSLKSAGFPDFSATHLEYKEAVAANKPIRMFVRDRLEADYNIWRKNSNKDGLQLLWCKHRDDWRLFDLLAEHRTLSQAKAQSNWLWAFKNSTELKERLEIDFKTAFATINVKRLVTLGRVPLIETFCNLISSDGRNYELQFSISNLSQAPALFPIFELDTGVGAPIRSAKEPSFPSLKGGQSLALQRHWAIQLGNFELTSSVYFSIVEGHNFCCKTIHKFTCDVKSGGLLISQRSNRRIYQGPTDELTLAIA